MLAWKGTKRGPAPIIRKCRYLEPSQSSELSYRVRGSSIFMNGHVSEKLPNMVPKSLHLDTTGVKKAPQIPFGEVLRCA